MLNSGGGHAQHGSGFPDTAERFNHFAGARHSRLVYENRIDRQAVIYEIGTGYGCSKFVQSGVDDRDRIKDAFETRPDLTREWLAAAMKISVPSLGRLLRKERELGASERDRAFVALVALGFSRAAEQARGEQSCDESAHFPSS